MNHSRKNGSKIHDDGKSVMRNIRQFSDNIVEGAKATFAPAYLTAIAA